MNVPLIGQRNPLWKDEKLGTSSETIGSAGCVITCISMLSEYYGHPITPSALNRLLTQGNYYTQGNLFVWDSLTKLTPDIRLDAVINCKDTPAPLDKIDEYLSLNKPVIVKLDFDHDPSDGIQTHFVVLVGKQGTDYIMNDPWYADVTGFTGRYGDPAAKILEVVLYSGSIPTIPSSEVLFKVKVSSNGLNGRNLPDNVKGTILKVYRKDEELSVISTIDGTTVSGIKKWYLVSDSPTPLYVWSGAVSLVEEVIDTPVELVVDYKALNDDYIKCIQTIYEMTHDILAAHNALPVGDTKTNLWDKISKFLNMKII